MNIEKLKKAFEFCETFLSKEEYSMIIAAIDFAYVIIRLDADIFINSVTKDTIKDFQNKADAFAYFLQDDS